MVFLFSCSVHKNASILHVILSYLKNNGPILPYLGKQLRRVKLVNKVLVTQFLFFRPRILMPNIVFRSDPVLLKVPIKSRMKA